MKRGTKIYTGVVALLCCTQVLAQGFWLPTGDLGLRDDVTLLADEGVIRLPIMAWPIPVDDAAGATAAVDVDMIREPALQAALLRVRASINAATAHEQAVQGISVAGGRSSLLRGYDEIAREQGEITVRSGARTGPWSVSVVVTGAASPADDKHLRFDGSDLSLRAGNWLLSANAMSRWWGPGRDGSLILSNNARPMPGISLDRVRTTPFSIPIIRWLGPWRFSALVAMMEHTRPDVQRPLFMAMRASFQPVSIFEAGVSRSAQFCGKNRPCDISTFGRVLFGRDNVGIRVAPEDEPGNQMAGFDARLTSPFRLLPIAVYAQMIGEDSSSSTIPEKYLGLFGIEGWVLLEDGSSLRGHLEYSNTSCSYFREVPYINCGYKQGIFSAGYRYYGRTIGHTSDSDSEMRAAGLSWRLVTGDELTLNIRSASLDRFGGVDPYNIVTAGPSRYRSAAGAWRGRRLNLDLHVQLGLEEKRAQGLPATRQVFGFLSIGRAL